jgi:hypothetical protein
MDTLLERLQPRNAVAIVPADGADLAHTAIAIYVGVSGDIVVDTLGGQANVTFKSVPVGILPGQFKRVRATGTTATNLLALY